MGNSLFDSLSPVQGSVLNATTSTQQPNESLLQHSASSVSLPDSLQQDNIRRSYSSTHSSLDGEEVKVSSVFSLTSISHNNIFPHKS